MDKLSSYIPIDKISESMSENNTTPVGLIVKTIIIVIVILGFVLISYLILSRFTGKKVEKMEVSNSLNTSTISAPGQNFAGDLMVKAVQSGVTQVASESVSSINTSINVSQPTNQSTNPPIQVPAQSVMTESESKPAVSVSSEEKSMETSIESPEVKQQVNPYVVKTQYAKLEEITLPSSIDGPKGYISRDKVCYRYKAKDDNFVKKRFGCVACQVDNRKGMQHDYYGTNTNVVATCVYAANEDPTDHTIWTRDKCVSVCSNDPEYKDIDA